MAPQQAEPAWARRLEEQQRAALSLLSTISATLDRLVLVTRGVEDKMSDLSNAVDDLGNTLTDQLEAIDAEIDQLAQNVAAGQDVSAQVDRIRATTSQMRDSITRLQADDTPPPAGGAPTGG